MNRREFSRYFLAGGAALLAPAGVWPAGRLAGSPQQNSNPAFDLVIECGTVGAPAQTLHAALNVDIKDGKIAKVSTNIAKERAMKVLSAKDKIVTPGFIDLHT